MVYPRVSLYAVMLAAAGIPLYIHLPSFASQHLGIPLASLGAVLLAIRVIDLVQDPAIGWAVDHWPGAQSGFAAAALLGLGVGFPWLFTLEPGPGVIGEALAALVVLFSAYSLGMILLYGRSASLAGRTDQPALLRVAAYREAGMLAGVVVAAAAPSMFAAFGAARDGYPAFGWMLAVLALAVLVLTRPAWQRPVILGERTDWQAMRRAGVARLLIIALVNALPVALTATLFLFFVESRLALPSTYAGPLLLLFFVSAGLSVPLWTWLAARIGMRTTLVIAMPLAILAFIAAAVLEAGALIPFALICVASGAALGADMVLLPAIFSVALTRARLKASLAFGLWSFAGKLALALVAAIALPLLQWAGFEPGGGNDARALNALTLTYAVLPCVLKVIAIALVLTLPKEEAHP